VTHGDLSVTTSGPQEPYVPEPTIDGPFVLRRFIQYGIMLVLGGGLAFAAAQTSGAAGVALGVLALLLIVVAIWSILFMTVVERIRRKIDRLNGK
jgi:hypothetical protein